MVEQKVFTLPGNSLARVAARVALILVTVLPVGAAAQVGYGAYFLRADDPVATAVVARLPAPAADLGNYQQLLQAVELAGGPYADGLAEPLAQLGDQLFARGDYPAAVASYRRALHVLRVNDGLYSERQIPVLRKLILAFRETGDWQTLDERYEYLFRLYGMGRGPYTEMRLRAATEYLRWQREALQRNLDKKERRLLDLIALNNALLDGVMDDPSAPYEWKKAYVRSQMANYYLAVEVFAPYVQRVQMSQSRDVFGAQSMTVDLDQQRMLNVLRTAPAKGRQMLQSLRLAVGDNPVELASLYLALGDWYHWTGNRRRAADAYTAVEQTLRDAGEEDTLALWLGEPVELPANGAFVRPPLQSDPATVRARFDVSAQGRVSNVEVTSVQGEPSSVSQFQRKLGATLFRPRWEGGRAVSSGAVVRDYRLLQ